MEENSSKSGRNSSSMSTEVIVEDIHHSSRMTFILQNVTVYESVVYSTRLHLSQDVKSETRKLKICQMDVAECYVSGGSLRSNVAVGDEQGLKWVAIQRLPTYDRLRKCLFTDSKGGVTEIDVANLGFQQTRRTLLDRLVKVAKEDNKRFLLRLKDRFQRVGIEFPTIEVRFENLNIETEAHFGTRALPTFLNFSIDILEGLLNALHIYPSRKTRLCILQDFSGIIRPRRITLLLGPPCSGKTTLLLALAGKLDPKLKFLGRVTYNGHEMNEFVPQRTAAYISQNDIHIPEMTVRETLEFSAKCQGIGHRYGMLVELLRREKESNINPDPDIDVYMKAIATEGLHASMVTEYVLKVLGLEACADTIVGDQMLRGISGGQRKRVTIGEMLVGPAKVLFMDEISTGLDSSTTYQIVNSIKQSIHILDGTAVISLLQPAPETYDLFDDIILLSDGQIIYQGPREHALEFFEHMGFKCPERKGVADFLQEVTSRKDQQQYWANEDQHYSFITAKEFSDAFQSFHAGREIKNDLSTPFDKTKSHPAALMTKKYGVGKMELLKVCFSRELLLMNRNSFVYIFKLAQLVIMAIVEMTIFFRTEMHRDSLVDGGMYMSSLFFSMIFIMFNGVSEISMTIAKLPVFYKQRDFLFYPAWAYSITPWITKIPLAILQDGVWVLLTYYVIGYDPNVGRLFKQYLVLVLVSQMGSGLFRFIAAAGQKMSVAQTFGSFALLALFALGGFVLSRDNIKKWWIWGYWISPLMYGQNAIVVNEFLGQSWRKVLPNSTESLGVQVLKSRGFVTDSYWYWIGVGALFGFTLLFNFLSTLALTFLNPLQKPQAIVSEEDSSKEPEQTKLIESRRGSSSGFSSMRSEVIVDNSHHSRKGMVLPFEPHYITFNDIKYSVDMPQGMRNEGVTEEKLELLRGVSGAFRPGVLTALMGVSGAGKTTLMDVLAGRKTGGYIQGNITISGYPKKQETFARISGYCEQNDIHSPNVTVYESLLYSAWLRLPPEVNTETRKMFIEEVMDLVELKPLRQALVGLVGVSGLSTEQRKRVTIAVELVANPSIIFMDEPTSGLDARAAAIVMRTIRNTVDTGRTVVSTIHQPSIHIFESFDELFLIKQGGQEIYVGPLGHHSCDMINYFEAIQGVPNIKKGYNPATWMLEVTNPVQETALGLDFANIYRNSELYRRNQMLIEELSTPATGSNDLYFSTEYSQSFFTQSMACLWKQHLSYWHNPQYTATRFLLTSFIAFMFGTMFWDLGSKTTKKQDLFNAMGSMYATIIFLGIQNAMSVQPVVTVERTVFYRERAAGIYSPFPYAFAQVMIEFPYIFSQALAYSIIVYPMIGFEWTAVKFFWYLFFMYFTLLYYTFYGMMAVAVTPNQHLSSIVSATFFSLWNLFSGFIVPRTNTCMVEMVYAWFCPVAYTLYGLVSSQFGDIKNTLESGETVEDFLRNYFDFKHEFLVAIAAAVVGFATLFAFIFALSIRFLNYQRR